MPAYQLVGNWLKSNEHGNLVRTHDQERAVTREAVSASASAFAAIWSNPEGDVYDAI
jgi:hypothetical protein